MEPIKRSTLVYWSDDEDENETIEGGQNWEFIDGGIAKHNQFMHTLASNRLYPSTLYEYKVITIDNKDKSHVSNSFELHTPDLDQSTSFKFIATGDVGVVNAVSMPVFKQLAKSHDYDFVAIMGDQGYDLADFNGTKGDEYMNFAQEFYANVPILTTAGNHESAYNFSHYKNRFDLLPYKQSDFSDAMQYSINYKSLHLISFATEVFFYGSPEQIQTSLNWLEQDLIKATRQRSSVPWIAVIGHRPLYCSILSNPDCAENAERIRFGFDQQLGLETLLTKYNVDAYICGHKHNYERTFPVRNNTLLTTSYHNPPSFFQVITGNAGNYEGPDQFDNTSVLPNWLGHRFQGYGFSTVQVSHHHFDLHHYETNIDGTLGKLQDHVRVSKTPSHVNKQKIV
ncbi:Metallo-dependent phosphatase-like protein [Mucor mucedo]|uniref:Metallo-dependent phosphatase-like protein n=1 Tax=Mucor mucedo TaxID=29922 RepID=UPI002220DB7C|nr:Metallo-dependent phosphatase-like protein [Mucor mucedo]KAI7897263.1 Metallo-dependent phosphatase-like protein [Mucor mucedo]